ncbi:hypothetical protein SNE40_007829 [Patella caerulea]|uniref:Phosphodiesterase n=1 Tax=Patella caerulea TaxID=87958 RepID=A0AAN8Q909_PATCE
MADLTEDAVSKYLRDNPEFLAKWLSQNSLPDTGQCATKGNKEDGGETLLSGISNFSQIVKNSITGSIFKSYLQGERSRKVSVKKDRSSLIHMSESELFMELIRDIASELDVNVLCHKIIQNVSILTDSDRGSLFLCRGTKENRFLVSKLFDVTDTSTLEESIHTEENEIKVPFGKGIAGHVALTKETINIQDAYKDPRFNQEVDAKTGYRTHSILCMPIINFEGEVIGVAQIINKINGNHVFSQADEEVFQKYLTFCGIGITNAQLFEMSVQEFTRNQLLLHLARGVFEEQTNLNKLIEKIMLDAQEMLKCERCTIYLLEDSLENLWKEQKDSHKFTKQFMERLAKYPQKSLVMAMQDPSNSTGPNPQESEPERKHEYAKLEDVSFSMAFDFFAKDNGTIKEPSPLQLAKSKNTEIAKSVVVKGTTMNIPDLEMDGRFGSEPFIEEDGFHTRSVLSIPINNSDKKIIGVTQLINKKNGKPFNENDENIIEAFSIFTGLGIHNCQMYENACRLMAKQSVALEVLSYHATAQTEEAAKLLKDPLPSAGDLRLYSFDFDDIPLPDDGTLKAVIRMFTDADVINTFKIPVEVMCRWICSVKKNYRPVTYHNWRHAFNVCQTMFTMLYTGELRPVFEDLEVFAMMVACLCHDLDHRGTNNAFQVKVASPLAMLYSTSVLEHHHFDHCIMILNSEGNNIFQSLSPTEYRNAIKTLEHAILSTDLALYFKKRGDFKTLIENGEKKFDEPYKKDLLKAMMMTACDVAAITKPWEVQQQIAQLVANEFFEQGDLEKTQLGEKPMPMMDRDKKDELPKMQVGFIDAICLPVYKLFADMNPKLEPLYGGCLQNRTHWDNMDKAAKEQAKELEKPKVEAQPQENNKSEVEEKRKVIKPEDEDVNRTNVHNTKTNLPTHSPNGIINQSTKSQITDHHHHSKSQHSSSKAHASKMALDDHTPCKIQNGSHSRKQKSGFCVIT